MEEEHLNHPTAPILCVKIHLFNRGRELLLCARCMPFLSENQTLLNHSLSMLS